MNRLLSTAWANVVLMIVAAVLCKLDKDACRHVHAMATCDARRGGGCDNDNALCCPPFPAHASCTCPVPRAFAQCRTAAWSCLVPSREELAIGIMPLYYGSCVFLALGAFDHLVGQ